MVTFKVLVQVLHFFIPKMSDASEYYCFECTKCPQYSENDTEEVKREKYLTRLKIYPKDKYEKLDKHGKQKCATTFVCNFKNSKVGHCYLLHKKENGFPQSLTARSLNTITLSKSDAAKCNQFERDRKAKARGKLRECANMVKEKPKPKTEDQSKSVDANDEKAKFGAEDPSEHPDNRNPSKAKAKENKQPKEKSTIPNTSVAEGVKEAAQSTLSSSSKIGNTEV